MPHPSSKSETSRRRRTFAAIGAGVAACATVGSLLTDARSTWYERLKKPSWQPPRAAFPIVWTSLYAIIAVSAATVVTRLEAQGREAEATSFKRAPALGLGVYAAWCAFAAALSGQVAALNPDEDR